MKMAKNIILDSGFWYALYNERDQYHAEAEIYMDFINIHNLIVPWPSLYETLNTRFVRHRPWISSFSSVLRQHNVVVISDIPYRDSCFQSIVELSNNPKLYSLVDMVIREILQDASVRVHSIITFNPEDYIDVCTSKGIELIT